MRDVAEADEAEAAGVENRYGGLEIGVGGGACGRREEGDWGGEGVRDEGRGEVDGEEGADRASSQDSATGEGSVPGFFVGADEGFWAAVVVAVAVAVAVGGGRAVGGSRVSVWRDLESEADAVEELVCGRGEEKKGEFWRG